VPCETQIGSLREPSNFAGLPVVTDDCVRLEPPSWAKRLIVSFSGPGCVAFIGKSLARYRLMPARF